MRGFKRDILYSFHIINRERVPEVSQFDVCFQSKHIYRIRNKLNNEYKYWITQSAKLRAKHSQKVYKLHWIQNIYQKKKNCGGEKTAKLCCWESKKEREKKNVIKFPLKKYLWFLKKSMALSSCPRMTHIIISFSSFLRVYLKKENLSTRFSPLLYSNGSLFSFIQSLKKRLDAPG